MGDYWSIALKRVMYSGQVLEFPDLGINFDTFELGDSSNDVVRKTQNYLVYDYGLSKFHRPLIVNLKEISCVYLVQLDF